MFGLDNEYLVLGKWIPPHKHKSNFRLLNINYFFSYMYRSFLLHYSNNRNLFYIICKIQLHTLVVSTDYHLGTRNTESLHNTEFMKGRCLGLMII